MTKLRFLVALTLSAWLAALTLGCHADENDPAGQAGELGDATRRANAITNISRMYTNALANAGGDRNADAPKSIADATVEKLTQTYVDHPEDPRNGLAILDLFLEMRDPRSLPALIKALDWRAGSTETHAIRAASVLRQIEIAEGQKGEVIEALSNSLRRVNDPGPQGVQMRRELMRTLGDLDDPRGAPVLAEVMLNLDESKQPFAANLVAAMQLARIADESSVDSLIKALYAFPEENPGNRMNNYATLGLVHVGRPALEPLLETLRGNNPEANQLAAQYIAAVRAIDPNAADSMTQRSIVDTEAATALGQLGDREAIDALIEETQTPNTGSSISVPVQSRIFSAALALISINREESDAARIREALLSVYNRMELPQQIQLLVGMQQAMDPGLLPFMADKARRPRDPNDELPEMRQFAISSYAFLANASEVRELESIAQREPDGMIADVFSELQPVIDVAKECDQSLECWIGKLGDPNVMIVRKAAIMVARNGRGNAEALSALIAQLSHRDPTVRAAILYALDYAATDGSPEAVAKIDELAETEEGRDVWRRVEPVMRSVQARLAARH